MIKLINKLRRAHRDLCHHLGREPTPGELATKIGLTRDQVIDIQCCAQQPISLDQALEEHNDALLGDFRRYRQTFDTFDVTSRATLQHQPHKVLTTLPAGKARIIRLRFGLDDGHPRTVNDISQSHGLTRAQIQAIEAQAMARLRHVARSHDLSHYLD